MTGDILIGHSDGSHSTSRFTATYIRQGAALKIAAWQETGVEQVGTSHKPG
ncbi:hypothetical protein [Deinococcus sp.]|uniref:hypothetical protein n=1 Tax=Deinococcus sp. TaxID=47478 RepID=UPI003C7EC81F